jgi:hypothetical protein
MIKMRPARIALLACASVASLGLLVGVSPAGAKTVTKTKTFSSCLDTAVPIPDLGTSGQPSPVASFAARVGVPKFRGKPQDGVVTAFTSAGVRITHTFDSDLVITLVSPGGKAIALANREGGSGDGYGTGAAACTGSLVLFGDAFPTSIASPGNSGSNPVVGSFKPEQPLSTFVGGPARGFWTLVVADTLSGDSGSLNALSLNITYRYKKVKKT